MKSIGGKLGCDAYGKLGCDAYGQLVGNPDSRLLAFRILSREEQAKAIRRLAAVGHTEHTIAAATKLSVEFVRRILGEREPA